ncbi:hypothetical protein Q0Z83_101720 [Actinoplanes sichuanensis]|uniref:Flagellar basal body-associated protein FliL n=1 Tax=Actinoplanes sichuanensis TaxID=512349 RepID=A0ABW4AHC0_9ACTN|nr:hypothetical protein [Actinoplanes sichuanensis]BEL11981.1 hypothetical protein Q0Z83_101720 [Actinoplanes sichuanensis]
MTYPPHPGEHNPGGWGQPQPPQYPHQPDPTRPYSAPPAYDPNQPYGASPQYGPPGYPPPFPPPQPPRKSTNTPIVIGVVALFLVLCVGVVTSLYLIGKNASDADDLVDASGDKRTEATAEATAEPTIEATTQAPRATIKITEPAKLGGRPKLTGAEFEGITEEFRAEIASDPTAGDSFGAFYGDPTKENIVIAVAVETEVPLPGVALGGIFNGIGSGGLKVTNLTEASTGKFGGAAKCGDADGDGVPVAICSWADEGSIGMIMWHSKKAKQIKAEFPKLRAQIETRS